MYNISISAYNDKDRSIVYFNSKGSSLKEAISTVQQVATMALSNTGSTVIKTISISIDLEPEPEVSDPRD